jgi:hypothetical protein
MLLSHDMSKSAREQCETDISQRLTGSLRVRRGLAAAGMATSIILGTDPGNDTYIASAATLAVFTSIGVAEHADAKKRCRQLVGSYAVARGVAIDSIENRVVMGDKGPQEEYNPNSSTYKTSLTLRGIGADATGILSGTAGYAVANSRFEQVDSVTKVVLGVGSAAALWAVTSLSSRETNDRVWTYGQQLENIDEHASFGPQVLETVG